MKVIQFVPELNEGGVERGTVELSREYVKLGIESYVVSKGGKLVSQIENEGGIFYQFDVSSKNILTAPSRVSGLKKLIKKINPDILHCRSRVPAWLVHFANKELRIPLVTTVHGLNSINFYSKIMTSGDIVITVGEVVKKHITSNYDLTDKRIEVIQRGVDMQAFSPENVDNKFINEFKTKFNLHDKFIVSSVGRITWLKDYESFIKAIAKLKKSIPNITGIIVGGVREDKQKYFQSLQELARKHGVEENIIFTGNQSKVSEIYYLSDVSVNLSLKMGNIGRTVIEALAMNTPVIATTYEGLTNMIIDDVNGYLVKNQDVQGLSDKLELLHKNIENFRNVRESVNKEYTLETMVEKTVSIYKELLE